MKPEYFPPKEDVILQNEAPTDFYILVTGAVVNIIIIDSNSTCEFLTLVIVIYNDDFLRVLSNIPLFDRTY